MLSLRWQHINNNIIAAGTLLLCVLFLTCSAVVSLWELDLDLVLSGDVLDAATFRPHDGAVVALRDGHLHGHLGLLLEREQERGEEERRQLGNNGTDSKHNITSSGGYMTSGCKITEYNTTCLLLSHRIQVTRSVGYHGSQAALLHFMCLDVESLKTTLHVPFH